jgi:hypothetical protein
MTFEIDRPNQSPLCQVISAWVMVSAFAAIAFLASVI